jgi:hypothetical protein
MMKLGTEDENPSLIHPIDDYEQGASELSS